MAAIIWTDVTAFAADLSTVAAGAQTKILAYVNERFAVAELGGETSVDLHMARVFLAAHLATTTATGSGGVAGPVTSESAGSLSRSYGMLASTGGLGTTGFGVQLKDLLRVCCGGPRLTPCR